MPPTGTITSGWKLFASELEKQTNGRYKIDFYPAESLIKSAEQLNALGAGIADMGNCQLTSFQQSFPINTVVSLPSVAFPDTPAGHLAAQTAALQLFDKFPVIAAEFRQFKVIFRHPLPAYIMISKKSKVTVPNDVKGLKVACEGMNKDIVTMAGGAPVNMMPPAVYQSMDKGVVDAAMVGWFHVISEHFEEVGRLFPGLSNSRTNAAVCSDEWKFLEFLAPRCAKNYHRPGSYRPGHQYSIIYGTNSARPEKCRSQGYCHNSDSRTKEVMGRFN